MTSGGSVGSSAKGDSLSMRFRSKNAWSLLIEAVVLLGLVLTGTWLARP